MAPGGNRVSLMRGLWRDRCAFSALAQAIIRGCWTHRSGQPGHPQTSRFDVPNRTSALRQRHAEAFGQEFHAHHDAAVIQAVPQIRPQFKARVDTDTGQAADRVHQRT